MFGRGRNGIAIRGIENPSLVYPRSTGVAERRLRGADLAPTATSATLRSPHGDVILRRQRHPMPTADSDDARRRTIWCACCRRTCRSRPTGAISCCSTTSALSVAPAAGIELDDRREGADGRSFGFDVRGALARGRDARRYRRSLVHPPGRHEAARSGDRDRVHAHDRGHRSTNASRRRKRAAMSSSSVAARGCARRGQGSRRDPRDTSDGRIYKVLQDQLLLAPSARYSEGTVTFFASGGGAIRGESDPTAGRSCRRPTALASPSRTADTSCRARPRSRCASLRSIPASTRPRFGLSLEAPIAGVDRALNLDPDRAPDRDHGRVIAVEPGAAGNGILPFEVTAIARRRSPGIESVTNARPIRRGADIAPTGVGAASVERPRRWFAPTCSARSAQLPSGTRLVVADPSALPPGVDPERGVDPGQPGRDPRRRRRRRVYRELRAGFGRRSCDPIPSPAPSRSCRPPRPGSDAALGSARRSSNRTPIPDIDARALSGSFATATTSRSAARRRLRTAPSGLHRRT